MKKLLSFLFIAMLCSCASGPKTIVVQDWKREAGGKWIRDGLPKAIPDTVTRRQTLMYTKAKLYSAN